MRVMNCMEAVFSELGLYGRCESLRCAIMSAERATPLGSKSVGKEDVMSQESATSKDGTPIAHLCSREGPPLVLVHGTAADHGRWAPLLLAFEQRFTVCTVDRRGRGDSGDSDDYYAIEREFEDVTAVVDSVGEPANLLGHSYGALCTLEAAPCSPKMSASWCSTIQESRWQVRRSSRRRSQSLWRRWPISTGRRDINSPPIEGEV
jgi:hypothetical protein